MSRQEDDEKGNDGIDVRESAEGRATRGGIHRKRTVKSQAIRDSGGLRISRRLEAKRQAEATRE